MSVLHDTSTLYAALGSFFVAAAAVVRWILKRKGFIGRALADGLGLDAKNFEELKSTVTALAGTVTSLTGTVARQDLKIDKQDAKITDQEVRIDKLEADLEVKKAELTAALALHADNTVLIDSLRLRVSSLQTELDIAKMELSNAKATIVGRLPTRESDVPPPLSLEAVPFFTAQTLPPVPPPAEQAPPPANPAPTPEVTP